MQLRRCRIKKPSLLLLLYGAIPYPHSDKPDTDHDTDYENNAHYSAHHDTAYVARMRYLFFCRKDTITQSLDIRRRL